MLHLRTAVAICSGLLALTAYGAGTLYTISSNGPPAQRYNIVVLAEGYKSTHQSQFTLDVTNALTALLSREPFREYATAFNAYAIGVNSIQAGSDHPAYGIYKDTFFNSSYDSSDRLITIPKGTNGQLKIEAILDAHVPEWNLAILLVNDAVPGGSDGGGKTAICSRTAINDILIHEAAHAAGGLGDEYTTPNPGYPDLEEPNTTRETNRNNIKWKAWIEPQTPVPTPSTGDYSDTVGLFEGAHYHATGWYRPKLNCTMQSQYTPQFCEVCREALVLSFYGKIRPIEKAFPTSAPLSVTNADPVHFSVRLLEPVTHALGVSWIVNGVEWPEAAGTTFSLSAYQLPNGVHSVSALASDPTPFVRTDPNRVLHETVSWQLSVNLPSAARQVTLSAPRIRMGDTFYFGLSGTVPTADVETSTNLVDWVKAGTVQLVNGSGIYTNTAIRPGPVFFRARSLP